MLKECLNCGTEFKTYPSLKAKYCSMDCSAESQRKRTYEKYKCNCEVCGAEFLPKRPTDGGRFCSYECSGLANRKERVDRNGYWYVCKPNHPRANKQGYVPEHVLIMEHSIGRLLVGDEVVHHIDHNRKNNNLNNLMIMGKSEHSRHHMIENHASGKLCTEEQRKRASDRMKENNPCRNMKRGSDGRYISSFQQERV